MTIEQMRPKGRIQPMECASIRYTCEQIEDSVQRFRRSMKLFKEWKSAAEADVQHYEEADYLGKNKADFVGRAEDRVEREKAYVAEYSEDVNRLLEILQEARTLEKHILEFWTKKDKQKGGK